MKKDLHSKKQVFLEGTLQFVLDKGLFNLSLRPLAEALGTSDRMILHYFHSKDELLEEVLNALLVLTLERFDKIGEAKVSPKEFLAILPTILRDPENKKILSVWLELASYQKTQHRFNPEYASRLVTGITTWLLDRVAVPEGKNSQEFAHFILVIIEGYLVLESYDLSHLSNSAGNYLQEIFA